MRAIAYFLALAVPAAAAAQDDAVDSYLAAMDAFEAGDEPAYFATFAPTLRCYYGSRDVPIARVRRTRQAAIAPNVARPGTYVMRSPDDEPPRVVQRGPDIAVLIDAAREGTRARRRLHHKAVLMVRGAEGWRIAGEGGRGSRCFAELLRSETVSGVDPLASDDGIYDALRRGRDGWDDDGVWDLVPPDVGALELRRGGRSCRTRLYGLEVPRSAFSCDARLERCVAGSRVFRFATRGRRRELAAIIEYEDAPPARESARDEEAIGARDRICELHDRLRRGDLSLATDDLWTLVPPYPRWVPPVHRCGAEARRESSRAIRGMSSLPLSCSELNCHLDADGTGHVFVVARREAGALRLSVDGRDWITGDIIPAAYYRIMDGRCAP